jgi:hypothetical protein
VVHCTLNTGVHQAGLEAECHEAAPVRLAATATMLGAKV